MNLSDKIWITRKTRVYTEKRLRNYAFLSEILITLFSLFMVFLSIWNFVNSNEDINFLLICGAISLLAISIFISSQKFVERAGSIRNCYIRLDELYNKVKGCEKKQNEQLLKDYIANYSDILLNVENHSNYDFLCLRYSLRKKKETTLDVFTHWDYFQFIVEKSIRIFIVIFLFLSPIILLLFWRLFN